MGDSCNWKNKKLNLLEMATMAITPIDLELLKFISLLNSSQKEALIMYTKELLNAEENLKRQSVDEYNLEIDKAVEGIKNGEYTSLEDLEKEIESW